MGTPWVAANHIDMFIIKRDGVFGDFADDLRSKLQARNLRTLSSHSILNLYDGSEPTTDPADLTDGDRAWLAQRGVKLKPVN